MSVGVTRQNNLMQYTSPVFSGVNLILSIAPDVAEAVGPGANADGQLTGLTGQGTHGPFAWGLDYVQAKGNTPAAAASKQTIATGTKIRVGYRYMPAGQISVLAVTSKKENFASAAATQPTGLVVACNTAIGCELEQSGFGFSWDHMFGPFHPIVQYQTIDKIEGSGCTGTLCADTGAKQITVGMRYIFSKRTHVYVSYNKIDNEPNYNLDYNGASYTSRTGATSTAFPAGTQFVGADPTVIGVGMIHNF